MQLAVYGIVCSTWWRLSKREYEEKTEYLRLSITQTNLQVQVWCDHNPGQYSSCVLSQIQCANDPVPSRIAHPQNRI